MSPLGRWTARPTRCTSGDGIYRTFLQRLQSRRFDDHECEDGEDEQDDEGDDGVSVDEEEDEDVPGDEGGDGERGTIAGDADCDDSGDGNLESALQENAPPATSCSNDEDERRHRRPRLPSANVDDNDDDVIAHRARISIEELEEEAEMRETTLESLATRLSRLSDEMSAELQAASEL